MTFITIATIGYGEIIDLSGNVGGRVFTVFIAIAGIGVLMYIMTNITALVVEGDAIGNNTLLKAGIRRAKGLFAVTEDDNQNLVVSLTAKQLSPNVRVVARCNEIRNSEKMKRAGADAVMVSHPLEWLKLFPYNACHFCIGQNF